MSESNIAEKKFSNFFGLIWMLLASFLIAFTDTPYFSNNVTSHEIPGLLHNIYFGVGFLLWMVEDAKKIKFRPHKVLKFFSVILPQLAIIFYCFKSRGAKKGFLQLAKAILFLLLCLLTMLLVYEIFGFEQS